MLLALSVISAHGAGMGPTAYKIFDERGGSIGRLDDNDWCLPDPAKIVSSRHAEVCFSAGGFYLQDLSTNGTFINTREQAPLGHDAAHWLADGDRILIGEYEILVQIIDDGITALGTGEPPREAHAEAGLRIGEPVAELPTRSVQEATDPVNLLRMPGELNGAVGTPIQGGPGLPTAAIVPTDWQITRFRNAGLSAAEPPRSVAPAAAIAVPAAMAPSADTALSPADAVDLLLGLGIDPTAIELDPHQFAMLAGIRAAYATLIEHFDPDRLERQFAARLTGESTLQALSRPRYWDMYRESFQSFAAHSETGFRRLFGAVFEQAYHRTLDELLADARER